MGRIAIAVLLATASSLAGCGGSGAADDAARSGDDIVRLFRQQEIEPWVAQIPRAADQASAASTEDLAEFAQEAACAIAKAVADAPAPVDLQRIRNYVAIWAPTTASREQRDLLVAEIDSARATIESAGLSLQQLAELADGLCDVADATGGI